MQAGRISIVYRGLYNVAGNNDITDVSCGEVNDTSLQRVKIISLLGLPLKQE